MSRAANLKVRRAAGESTTVVNLNAHLRCGDGSFLVIAGPCALESENQVKLAAEGVAKGGAHALRGGAYKPRTSPYSFQGIGEPGLEMLAKAGHAHKMPVVSELLDAAHLPAMLEHVDVLQIGARNMHNFALLKQVGKVKKPVLLKRGFGATIEEWLHAAEYILDGGNEQVIFCERGIRSFDTTLRNTLDLAGMAWVHQHSKLPIIVDPSHATGELSLVRPMALAAAAAGADGIMVDVHPNPAEARCDGAQALTIPDFEELMESLEKILKATGRKLAKRHP